jgi:glyoxylase-like metal-dependent hydrolase (beta-lactamase superfamily II)
MLVEKVITSGQFTLDGQSFDVDNNVWLIDDDQGVIIVDAAHDAQKIFTALQGRRVHGIVCTHGHNDHINAALVLQELVDAPVSLHPADRMLWDVVHPEQAPDRELADGDVIHGLSVVHTPGHSPGGVCLVGEGVVFSGDTLFKGGPGATGRSFSDFPTIVESIRAKVLTLPDGTVVHTGHGEDTAVGDEAPHLQEWLDRGH